MSLIKNLGQSKNNCCQQWYKNNAQLVLKSKVLARLLRLIVLRTIKLASSHCFYTGRCVQLNQTYEETYFNFFLFDTPDFKKLQPVLADRSSDSIWKCYLL